MSNGERFGLAFCLFMAAFSAVGFGLAPDTKQHGAAWCLSVVFWLSQYRTCRRMVDEWVHERTRGVRP